MRDHIYFITIILLILLHGFLLIDRTQDINKHITELQNKVEQYQRMSEQDIDILLNNLKLK